LIAALRNAGVTVSAALSSANATVFAERALHRRHVAPVSARDLRGYSHALIATEDAYGYRLAYDARIPARIGFENGWGKPLKTLWIRRLCTTTVHRTAGLDPRAPHECEVLFELGRTLFGDDPEPSRDLAVLRPLVLDDEPRADDRIAVQITQKWQRFGQSDDAIVELVRRLERLGAVRLVGAASESDYIDAIARKLAAPVEQFATVRDWKNAVASARLYVAPDSGGIHVAGMVGTPTVAVFPAIREFASQTARWAPWAAPHRIVRMGDAWPVVAADAAGGLLSGTPAIYTG
jgi:ADP-heptose:LPS heptosyltransferase